MGDEMVVKIVRNHDFKLLTLIANTIKMTDDHCLMLMYMLIQSIYYRISTSCQVLHLSVVYVISAIFLNHRKYGVQNVMKDFVQNA